MASPERSAREPPEATPPSPEHLMRLHHMVEHVYLTDSGGVPLVHLSKIARDDIDPDLVASMFAAIQNFMDTAFRTFHAGDVKSMEIGDQMHVAFGRGHKILLYVVYRGRESNHLERRVIAQVEDLERQFAPLLGSWDGGTDRLGELRSHMEKEWNVPSVDPVHRGPVPPA